jgi:hypothetical protein
MMKDIRLLALVTMLALGFTLSAQTQTQNAIGADQYTAPAASDSTMSTQQSAASSTSVYTNTDLDNKSEFATTVSDQDKRQPQAETDYLQQLQDDSGAE